MAARGWEDTGIALSSAVARRVLATKRHDVGSKGVARSVAIGSWWTTGRWAKAGYKIDDCCPLCSSRLEPDSIWHRLWRCPATKDLREPRAVAAVARRAVQAGPTSVLYSTGLVPNPSATAPGPADTAFGDQLVGEAPWEAGQGELFWDGSATTIEVEGCNRASWAAVQYKPQEKAPHRVVRGVVPSCYPQTAQAAETCALWATVTLQGIGLDHDTGWQAAGLAATHPVGPPPTHPAGGKTGPVKSGPVGGKTGPVKVLPPCIVDLHSVNHATQPSTLAPPPRTAGSEGEDNSTSSSSSLQPRPGTHGEPQGAVVGNLSTDHPRTTHTPPANHAPAHRDRAAIGTTRSTPGSSSSSSSQALAGQEAAVAEQHTADTPRDGGSVGGGAEVGQHDCAAQGGDRSSGSGSSRQPPRRAATTHTPPANHAPAHRDRAAIGTTRSTPGSSSSSSSQALAGQEAAVAEQHTADTPRDGGSVGGGAEVGQHDCAAQGGDRSSGSGSSRQPPRRAAMPGQPREAILQWGDCATVVNRALAPPLTSRQMDRAMYADIWQDMWHGRHAGGKARALAATRKVAAHQLDTGRQPTPGTLEHYRALGNDWADSEAKAARGLHPSWARRERHYDLAYAMRGCQGHPGAGHAGSPTMATSRPTREECQRPGGGSGEGEDSRAEEAEGSSEAEGRQPAA